MPRHWIIYQAISPLKRFIYHIVRTFGAGLIAFAIVGIVFSYYPIFEEEVSYRSDRAPKVGFGDIIAKSDAKILGLNPYFSIYIPKIEARQDVIPNVNPGNFNEYSRALQEGIAHAAGTNFPGQGKLIYLFSHSTDSPLNFTRYNAVFYLLRKLENGDRITVFFLDKRYEYEVSQKVVADATDTSWLTDQGIGEYLVLQTCDPPGTTWNRLLIIAKMVVY
ncbi:MAG: sortase [Patescibacteria group bacterium]